jgi:hypothetical protein
LTLLLLADLIGFIFLLVIESSLSCFFSAASLVFSYFYFQQQLSWYVFPLHSGNCVFIFVFVFVYAYASRKWYFLSGGCSPQPPFVFINTSPSTSLRVHYLGFVVQSHLLSLHQLHGAVGPFGLIIQLVSLYPVSFIVHSSFSHS